MIILISSGLGLNTFLKQANSFNLESNGTNSQSIVTTIADQVNSFLGTNHSKSVVIEKIKGLINNIVYIVDGIASIVFLVGILDIINTMGFNLNERKREIAILKTLGFSKLQLLTSLSIEAGLLGLLGSIGGALIASIGLILAANIIGISISILIPPWLLIGVISLTTILCMILGILPAWFAVERDITEVLV
ncbi:FtsX-like permease family protein [Methanobacterium sp.]|uniref:FtsX-like permease family protein n=1 Tax=Methanobacterium sp. TaxID=2164 RepID=UPI003C707354